MDGIQSALCRIGGNCTHVAYDDCKSCHKPTCEEHGKIFDHGEHIICQSCGDNAPALIAALAANRELSLQSV